MKRSGDLFTYCVGRFAGIAVMAKNKGDSDIQHLAEEAVEEMGQRVIDATADEKTATPGATLAGEDSCTVESSRPRELLTSKEYPRLLTSTLEWYSKSSSADISSMARELLDRRATAYETGRSDALDYLAEARRYIECDPIAEERGVVDRFDAAVSTLSGSHETSDVERMRNTLLTAGYTDCGGELWKPPIGPRPLFLDENLTLRRLLAFAYSGSALYGDDGELQDGRHPMIDYVRDSVADIERKIGERGMAKLAAAACPECRYVIGHKAGCRSEKAAVGK